MTVTRELFVDAVKAYWDTKNSQLLKSEIAEKVGQGTAGSIRGGKHFDPLAAVVSKFFIDAGFPPDAVNYQKRGPLTLPGYYRPQKQWDLVVAYKGTLVAAIEFKALGGPSFGNNYNNRIEEALGSALDIRKAEWAKTFPGEKPWVGYFFIMQDEPGSRSEVGFAKGSKFDVEDIWKGTSYQDRFAIFCSRLLETELYNSVCYVTSSPTNPEPKEPVQDLDWQHFSASIQARLTYLRELGIPEDDSLW